ncbi:TolC family protein [Desulfobacter vibrioformis]|uniref:TolC family protein n=1 Tax=Desulfobacter vibrioformis TaxID=34031 RepID=UPI00068A21F4|nr:TolC family protein [Desulfobacter vibrioformis]
MKTWIFNYRKSCNGFGIAAVRMIMAICLCCTMSHVPLSFAQDTVPEVWTGPEAVRFALQNNPDAQIALKRIAASAAAIKEASAAFYPQLGAQAGYSRTNNPMYSFGNILNQGVFSNSIDFNNPGETDDLQFMLGLTYRIYNGGRSQAGVDAANARKKAAMLQEKAVKNSLGFAVVKSFFNIVQAKGNVSARQAAVQAIDASIQAARARFEEGDLLKQELLNLEVQQSLASEDLIQAQHGLALSKQSLLNVLGLTGNQVDINLDQTPLQPVPTQPDFKDRSEILAMQFLIQARQAGLRQAKSGYYPTADAFGSYQVDKGFEIGSGSGDSWMAGIRVNMTLFDGKQTDARVQQASIALAQEKDELRKMELAYALEIRQAVLTLDQTDKRCRVTEKMVASAQASACLFRERFKAGLVLSSELIDAENRLTEAQVRHTLANAEHRIAVANLRRACGLLQYSE